MGFGEGLADFDDLAAGLIGAEIDGGANRGGAHVVGLFDGAEEDLIGFVGEGEEFVVIDFYDEGNFVRVFAGDGTEDAVSGSDGVAAAFDGELDDVFTVEIVGILGEAGAGRVLDALINRENGEVAGVTEASGAEEALEIGEDTDVAIGEGVDAVDEIGAGEMQAFLGDFGGFEAEERFGFGA